MGNPETGPDSGHAGPEAVSRAVGIDREHRRKMLHDIEYGRAVVATATVVRLIVTANDLEDRLIELQLDHAKLNREYDAAIMARNALREELGRLTSKKKKKRHREP